MEEQGSIDAIATQITRLAVFFVEIIYNTSWPLVLNIAFDYQNVH